MSNRNALLAKSSIAVKELAIDEDDFRSLLESRYGVRSRTKMKDGQLIDLVEHLQTKGWQPKKAGPKAVSNKVQKGRKPASKLRGDQSKARALWISGYYLGVFHDLEGSGLNSFVRRQTGVDALRFANAAQTAKVIEGLKAMLAREGGVDWACSNPLPGPMQGASSQARLDRLNVLFALSRRLNPDGPTPFSHDRKSAFYHEAVVVDAARPRQKQRPRIEEISDAELDGAIRALGLKMRRRIARRKEQAKG